MIVWCINAAQGEYSDHSDDTLAPAYLDRSKAEAKAVELVKSHKATSWERTDRDNGGISWAANEYARWYCVWPLEVE